MKKALFAIVCLSIFGITYAQSPLSVGETQINVGVGLSGWGVPVYIGLDHAILPDLTIGGELSDRSYNEYWENNLYRHNIVGIAANGNYHFNTLLNIPRNIDFYAGLNVGFYFWNSPADYGGSNNSGLGLGAQVGGRYYFTRRTALNVEFGGGNEFSEGKLGLSFKL